MHAQNNWSSIPNEGNKRKKSLSTQWTRCIWFWCMRKRIWILLLLLPEYVRLWKCEDQNISSEILKMCHMHCIFSSSCVSASVSFTFPEIIMFWLFCFVSFRISSSSGCCCWYCVYCMCVSIFIPLSIHRLVRSCSNFQLHTFYSNEFLRENLMCTGTCICISICKLYCLCLLFTVYCSLFAMHTHADVYGSAAQSTKTEWSSTKVVLFCCFSVRLSFDCCVRECVCTENWARFAFGPRDNKITRELKTKPL